MEFWGIEREREFMGEVRIGAPRLQASLLEILRHPCGHSLTMRSAPETATRSKTPDGAPRATPTASSKSHDYMRAEHPRRMAKKPNGPFPF